MSYHRDVRIEKRKILWKLMGTENQNFYVKSMGGFECDRLPYFYFNFLKNGSLGVNKLCNHFMTVF
jgi:hypothetical protein